MILLQKLLLVILMAGLMAGIGAKTDDASFPCLSARPLVLHHLRA